MANKLYGTFESTHTTGRNFSFVSDRDMENGMLVHRGELVDDVKGYEVYRAVMPTAQSISANEPVYVVGNPAWNYDTSSIINQNEDQYFIPAGKVFRVYSLNVSDRFGVADYGIEGGDATVGEYVGLLSGSARPVRSASEPANGFAARIIEIREMGNVYHVGQKVDQTSRRVRVEVTRNG